MSDDLDQTPSDGPVNPAVPEEDGPGYTGLVVALLSIVGLVLCWAMGWTLATYIAAVIVISVVIWQACDPFADAAQWIGTEMEIPGSVRGATLDAVASSMPELFTGIFFVLVVFLGNTEAANEEVSGYGSAIATCAGSAVYNMIVIPACCALIISYYRPKRPTIDVEDEVLMRDGLWFLGSEAVLLVFLFQPHLYAWMGLFLLGMYVAYVVHLSIDAKRYRRKLRPLEDKIRTHGFETDPELIRTEMAGENIKVSRNFVANVQRRMAEGEDPLNDDDEPESAGVFFGFFDVKLRQSTAWTIIALCTVVAAGACYFLVEVTNGIADTLAISPFFVAVIVAAAASSVPDTFLSIGSATRGDDDGAVSNAFGSNIFDICICLSIPLLLNSYLNGWGPVDLLDKDGNTIEGLAPLRVLLWFLSLLTLAVIWHRKQLTRNKAIFLLALYIGFIGYAIWGARDSKADDTAAPVQESVAVATQE